MISIPAPVTGGYARIPNPRSPSGGGGGGSAIAQGVRTLTGAIDFVDRLKNEDDERKAGMAEINLRAAGQRATQGTEDAPGYMGTRGERALDGYAPAVEALEKQRDDILGGLTPSQRKIAEAPFRLYTQEVAGRWAEHREKQRVEHMSAIAQAQLTAVVQDVAQTHDPFDQPLFEGTITHSADVIAKRGAELGKTADMVQNEVRAFTQQMTLARLTAAVKVSPQKALRLWAHEKRNVPAKDWEAAETMVLTRAREALVHGVISQVQPLKSAAEKQAFLSELKDEDIVNLFVRPTPTATAEAGKQQQTEQAKDAASAIQTMRPGDPKAQDALVRAVRNLNIRTEVQRYIVAAHQADKASREVMVQDLVTTTAQDLHQAGARDLKSIKKALANNKDLQAFPAKGRAEVEELIRKEVVSLTSQHGSAQEDYYANSLVKGLQRANVPLSEQRLYVAGELGRKAAATMGSPDAIWSKVSSKATAMVNRTTAVTTEALRIAGDITKVPRTVQQSAPELFRSELQKRTAQAKKLEIEAEKKQVQRVTTGFVKQIAAGEMTLAQVFEKHPELQGEYISNHPKELEKLNAAEKARVNGGFASEDNPDAVYRLATMAPDKFARLDLTTIRSQVTQAQYKALVEEQQSLRKTARVGSNESKLYNAAKQELNRQLPAKLREAAENPNKASLEERLTLNLAYKQISSFAANNPLAKDNDMRNKVNEIFTDVVVRNAGFLWLDKQMPAVQAKARAQIKNRSESRDTYVEPYETADPAVRRGFGGLTKMWQRRLSDRPELQTVVAKMFAKEEYRDRDWPTYVRNFLRTSRGLKRLSDGAVGQFIVLWARYQAGDPNASAQVEAFLTALKQKQGAK